MDNINEDQIVARFSEKFTIFSNDETSSSSMTKEHSIITDKKIPKLGVMLVGLGGNNGSTFVAGILANKKNLTWETKTGTQKANFYGSFT